MLLPRCGPQTRRSERLTIALHPRRAPTALSAAGCGPVSAGATRIRPKSGREPGVDDVEEDLPGLPFQPRRMPALREFLVLEVRHMHLQIVSD